MTQREKLIELLIEANDIVLRNGFRFNANVMADHLLANGVIVPPCKVGDTVYELQPERHRAQAYTVTTIKYNGHYWWCTWVLKDDEGVYGNVEGFSEHQIGKTVFRTREEAENALKGGAE